MAWKEQYDAAGGDRRYRVVYRRADGKKKSKSFTRSKDADRFKAEIERRQLLGELYEETPITFGEFAGLRIDRGRVVISEDDEGWFSRYQVNVKPSSYARRAQCVQHLAPLVPLRIDRITPQVVEDAVVVVARTKARTAQMVLQTVRSILKSAKLRGQRVHSGIFDLPAPKHESRPKAFLTKAEVDSLASASSEPALIRFTALTGLRQAELFALTDSDIRDDGGAVTVRASKTAAGRRTIPLIAEARVLLAEQRLARPKGCELLFPSPQGHPWNKDNFNHRVFKPAVKKAGLSQRRVRFHDLRHTFAAFGIAAGMHPKELQSLMGHTSIKVTMDTYGHLYEGAQAAAMEQLERFLGQPAPSVPHQEEEPSGVDDSDTAWLANGSDGTRTRDLRRDRPAF